MSLVYNIAKRQLLDAQLDLDADVLRIMLVDNTYTANADHDFVSQTGLEAAELSGTGYARQTLGTIGVSEDDANDRGEFTAANVTWSGINAGTAEAAIIYKQVGGDDSTPANDVLIAYIDTGGFPVTTNGGDLTIQWNAEGILQLA